MKVLFRRKRTKNTVTPATRPPPQPTAPTPPAVEVQEQNDPPPYSAPPSSSSDAIVPPEMAHPGVLDPSLRFTAAHMEQLWLEKDRLFARIVVQFIAERFDGNLKGWAGYKYTYINPEENPPRKESLWDDLIGFNAWGYRGRFKQVGHLVKRDFERRGFDVRKCEIYSSQDGIYVQWHLDIRKVPK